MPGESPSDERLLGAFPAPSFFDGLPPELVPPCPDMLPVPLVPLDSCWAALVLLAVGVSPSFLLPLLGGVVAGPVPDEALAAASGAVVTPVACSYISQAFSKVSIRERLNLKNSRRSAKASVSRATNGDR
eukprot:8592018-Alexandrium_andersonii.AAC.1